jgi:triosephosphate isomerase
MRRPLVMGNWKMHLTAASTESLAREIAEGIFERGWNVDVGVCPPHPYLERVAGVVRATDVVLGAQNGHWAENGAFTGEVSMEMLVDVGCDYVILGHSERRVYFGERDSFIQKKVAAGLSRGLHVILCVGETEPQRDDGVTEEVIDGQLDGALTGLSVDSAQKLAIAYEPVWAIGTGKTATPEQAQQVHAFIRRWVARGIGPVFAEDMRILYGGSVKPDNMASLMSMPDIDGALVGGASLRGDSFLGIVRHAAERGY